MSPQRSEALLEPDIGQICAAVDTWVLGMPLEVQQSSLAESFVAMGVDPAGAEAASQTRGDIRNKFVGGVALSPLDLDDKVEVLRVAAEKVDDNPFLRHTGRRMVLSVLSRWHLVLSSAADKGVDNVKHREVDMLFETREACKRNIPRATSEQRRLKRFTFGDSALPAMLLEIDEQANALYRATYGQSA